MFNVVDLVALLIVFIGALIAYKRGFVKTFFGFISTFLAIIVAFIFCNIGTEILKNNTGIDEWIEMTLTNVVASKEDSTEETVTESSNKVSAEEDSEGIVEYALKDLPKSIQEAVSLEEYKENVKLTLVQKAVPIILKVLAWVIIYFCTRLILWILCIIFDGIMNIPFLKEINSMAGLALGIILGIFRIYVILALISFFVSVVPMDAILTSIKSSMIISIMYENNLLINLIF